MCQLHIGTETEDRHFYNVMRAEYQTKKSLKPHKKKDSMNEVSCNVSQMSQESIGDLQQNATMLISHQHRPNFNMTIDPLRDPAVAQQPPPRHPSPDKFSHPDPPRVDLAQPRTINNFKGTKAAKLGPPLSTVMTNELLPSFAH